MTEAQFHALKSTMPWRHHSYQTPKGQVIIQMIDNAGREVPLFSMIEFLEIVTAKMAAKPEKESSNAQQATTD
jgi:hypothetical protein